MDDAATPAAISGPSTKKPRLDAAGLQFEPNLHSEESASTSVVSGETTFTTSEVLKLLQRLMPDLVRIMKISPFIVVNIIIIFYLLLLLFSL